MVVTDDFELPDLRHARAHLDDVAYRRKFQQLDFFEPAPQQKRVINSQTKYTFAQAGNQSGKSQMSAYLVACHASQRFPSWFTGRRVPKANLANRAYDRLIWCLSKTNTVIRDVGQTRLLGSVMAGTVGQALIPADRIMNLQASRGIAGLADTAIIKADDGSTTGIQFKSYDMSREALQGAPVDLIWLDETLGDEAMFAELQARLTATDGSMVMSATPALQQSPVVRWFHETGRSDRQVLRMSTLETTHLIADVVAKMAEGYSARERRTRIHGEDYSGGGLVLEAPKDVVAHSKRLASFPRWCGKLTGFDPSHGGMSESAHPTAVVMCVYMHDNDMFFVLEAWKEARLLPGQVVQRIKETPWADAPVAWGAGETQSQGKDGDTYAAMDKKLGLRMLSTHATLPGGGYSLNASFDQIQDAMLLGKLKIAEHLTDLWDEIAGLERDENNKIITVRDDLLSALRYAYIMRKYARDVEMERAGIFAKLYRGQGAPQIARGLDFDVFTGR